MKLIQPVFTEKSELSLKKVEEKKSKQTCKSKESLFVPAEFETIKTFAEPNVRNKLSQEGFKEGTKVSCPGLVYREKKTTN